MTGKFLSSIVVQTFTIGISLLTILNQITDLEIIVKADPTPFPTTTTANFKLIGQIESPKILQKRSESILDSIENFQSKKDGAETRLRTKLNQKAKKFWSNGPSGGGVGPILPETGKVRATELKEQDDNIVYIGCVAVWDEQRTTFKTIETTHDENHTPASCAGQCQKGVIMFLI